MADLGHMATPLTSGAMPAVTLPDGFNLHVLRYRRLQLVCASDGPELQLEGMMFVGDRGKSLAGLRGENPQIIHHLIA